MNFRTKAEKITISGRLSGMLGSVEVCLSVSDSSVGMTPTQMEKIFGLSKKNTTLGTKGEKGASLDLLVSEELIEKNSGKLK